MSLTPLHPRISGAQLQSSDFHLHSNKRALPFHTGALWRVQLSYLMVLLPRHPFCWLCGPQGPQTETCPLMQACALDSSPQSHKQIQAPHMTSPTAPVITSFPCLPGPAPYTPPLDKTPMELTRTLHFPSELTNLALAWEYQSTPLMYPNKDICSGSCCFLCLHPV